MMIVKERAAGISSSFVRPERLDLGAKANDLYRERYSRESVVAGSERIQLWEGFETRPPR